MDKLKSVAKMLTTAVGGTLTVLVFVSEHLGWALPDSVQAPLGIAIMALTTLMTYLVPNKKPQVPAQQP